MLWQSKHDKTIKQQYCKCKSPKVKLPKISRVQKVKTQILQVQKWQRSRAKLLYNFYELVFNIGFHCLQTVHNSVNETENCDFWHSFPIRPFTIRSTPQPVMCGVLVASCTRYGVLDINLMKATPTQR